MLLQVQGWCCFTLGNWTRHGKTVQGFHHLVGVQASMHWGPSECTLGLTGLPFLCSLDLELGIQSVNVRELCSGLSRSRSQLW